MTFVIEIDIAAPPEVVFRSVADFSISPRWYSALRHVARVHGDGGLGTEYAAHRLLPTGVAVNAVTVTTYDEGREVTFTSTSGPTPFTYRYRVAPTATGATLQLEGSISAMGLPLPGPARLLGSVAEQLFSRGMRDNLTDLKEIIEQQG